MTTGYFINEDKTNAITCDIDVVEMIGDWTRVTKEEYDTFVEFKTGKTINTTLYLHSDKSDMHYRGIDLGLKEEALDKFKYALYEVALRVEIIRETGEYKLIEIRDNGKVYRPVEI